MSVTRTSMLLPALIFLSSCNGGSTQASSEVGTHGNPIDPVTSAALPTNARPTIAMPEWDEDEVYPPGSIVQFDGQNYVSTALVTGGDPVEQPTLWRLVDTESDVSNEEVLAEISSFSGSDGEIPTAVASPEINTVVALTEPSAGELAAALPVTPPQGPPGVDGEPGLVWKGSWQAGEIYETGDAVMYDDQSFIATAQTDGVALPTDNVFWDLLAARGATGQQGPQGERGEMGLTGLQGDVGPAGAQGERGSTGPMGPPGLAGALGPRGAQGETGQQGPQGPEGPQGDTGLMGPQGDAGPAGPQGDTGPAGPQGDAGPQGPQGDTGAAGPQGDAGPAGPQGDTGPQGPQGDVGPAGTQGDAGPAGPQGDTGPQGPQGDTGPQGPQGDAGAQGPQGDTGPTGPQGDAGSTGPQGIPGLTWEGDWSAIGGYNSGDAVSYLGSAYIANQAVPAGTLPTDTTYWDVLAAAGEDSTSGGSGSTRYVMAGITTDQFSGDAGYRPMNAACKADFGASARLATSLEIARYPLNTTFSGLGWVQGIAHPSNIAIDNTTGIDLSGSTATNLTCNGWTDTSSTTRALVLQGSSLSFTQFDNCNITVGAVCSVVDGVEQSYEFAGFTTSATTLAGSAGYLNMTNACRTDFGSTARMATTEEVVQSNLGTAQSGVAWVHGIAHASDPGIDAISGITTGAGASLTCKGWGDTNSNLGLIVNGANFKIDTQFCYSQSAVACSVPQ